MSLQRDATADELVALKALLASAPTSVTRFKQGIENGFVLWATSLLGFVVVWWVVGWLVSKFVPVDFGLHSSSMLLVLAIATPVFAVFGAISSIRWLRRWPDIRLLLRGDLAAAKVCEERYVFAEAKRFQEPEFGGLVYFLRSAQDEVFTLYDGESQILGIDGEDPMQSSYRPQTELLIVRAPKSGFVLNRQCSGALLSVGEPVDLPLKPKAWPKNEAVWDIQWNQLEVWSGSSTAAADVRGEGR